MTDHQYSRISGKYLWDSFLKAFDLERGLIFTIRELTIRPGKAIQSYFNGERKLFNPIKYAILVIAIFEIIAFLNKKISPAFKGDFEITHTIIGFVIGLMLFSLIFYLLNHRKGYNFFE